MQNSCTMRVWTGPLWGWKAALWVRGASERYEGGGCFEELISLTTLDTAAFHSAHLLWHPGTIIHSLMSLSPISVCDPSTLLLCAGFSSVCWSWWIVTHKNHTQSAGEEQSRLHYEHILGWANGIKSLELQRDSLKRNSLSPLSFSLALSPLYHQISFCKRIS